MTNKKYKGLYYETPMFLGYVFLALLFISVFIYLLKKPLISPVVQGIVPEVKAQYSVSCEDPKGYLECQVYKGIIDWNDHSKLSKIIQCESKCNPNAFNVNKNGSVDRGLFQINTVHKLLNEDAFNFKKNIDYGIKLYKQSGTSPWVCARILNIK